MNNQIIFALKLFKSLNSWNDFLSSFIFEAIGNCFQLKYFL